MAGTPGGALLSGGPAVVVFVAAAAVAGSATSARAATIAAFIRFVTSSPPGSYVGSNRGVKPLIGFGRTYAHRLSRVNRAPRERDVARRRNTPPRGRVGSAVRRRPEPMSSEPTAQRTLVKSPPELWAEVSDVEALARHLGEFGEIRITRLEPETTVAWEGERASGTVHLEPSGWGTKVTLTASVPEPEEPEAGARARAAVEPERPSPSPSPSPNPSRRRARARRREARLLGAAFGRRRKPEPAAAEPSRAGAGARRDRARAAQSPSPAPEPEPGARARAASPEPALDTPAGRESSSGCSTTSAPRTTARSRAAEGAPTRGGP